MTKNVYDEGTIAHVGTKLWNELPDEIKDSNRFPVLLKKYIIRVVKVCSLFHVLVFFYAGVCRDLTVFWIYMYTYFCLVYLFMACVGVSVEIRYLNFLFECMSLMHQYVCKYVLMPAI